jgi:signal transduction histidine kinase
LSALERLNNEGLRLSALLIGLFAASALLLGVMAYVIAGRAMRAELHDFISAEQGAVASGFRSEGLSEAVEVVQQLMASPRVSGRYLLQDRAGHKLAGDLPDMPPRRGQFEVSVRESGGGRHLVLGEGTLLPDGAYLFVGQNTDGLAGTRARLLGSFGWIIGATILLALTGGALLSAGYLRRIDAIIRTCQAVMAGRLGERTPVAGSQGQLDRLSAAINDMLDRIATLVESLRQVSSDIAHDLRTPLTRLRQRLESARNGQGREQQLEAIVEGALQDCDAILAVFSALLRISQIESGTRLASFSEVPLCELLAQLAELFRPVAEDNQQRLVIQLCGPLSVRADRTLLMQMFSNLLENAIRHAGRGALIRIDCQRLGADAVVRVIDSGPGIPAAEHQRVFDRLYRLERSRNTPGNGLGLALVAAILKLHRFTVALSDAAPGLCVTIRMPLQPVSSELPAPQGTRATAPVATAWGR